MNEPFQDMPNQRPNPVGSGLASLAQFFSDSRVDQGKLHAMAAMLTKRGVTASGMQRIVTAAMEECDRFPTLAWMLKVTGKRRTDGKGWEDDGPHASGDLDREMVPHERRWLSERNQDLWEITVALRAGKEPTDLLAKWRLYVDHNSYVRAAPGGDLVRTRFANRAEIAAEVGRACS